MGVHPIWVPGLNQHGPPPGANSERREIHAQAKREFECETVADLRRIEHHHLNFRCVLLGENEAFDGYLQGLYHWWKSTDEDNGGDTIRPNDYQGWLWKKLT